MTRQGCLADQGEILRAEPGAGGRVPPAIPGAKLAAWDDHLITAIGTTS
jgi:hypothetical protein